MQNFYKLVADMREAQKEYFRTRSASALSKSKQRERVVDLALAKLAEKQKTLFEE